MLFFILNFKKVLTNLLLCGIICNVVDAALAQLDRVPGYEPVGRGFESLMPRHNKVLYFSAPFIYIIYIMKNISGSIGFRKYFLFSVDDPAQLRHGTKSSLIVLLSRVIVV